MKRHARARDWRRSSCIRLVAVLAALVSASPVEGQVINRLDVPTPRVLHAPLIAGATAIDSVEAPNWGIMTAVGIGVAVLSYQVTPHVLDEFVVQHGDAYPYYSVPGTLLIPLSVHFSNERRGRFTPSLFTSAASFAIGYFAMRQGYRDFLPLIPLVQVGTSIWIEGHTSHPEE